MGGTLSDGLKMGIVMVIMCAVIFAIMVVTAMSIIWNREMQSKYNENKFVDHLSEFTTMAVYGKPLPMPNVVAALDLYGNPEVLCVQMEDLKGEMGGTPYPIATDSDSQLMKDLLTTLKKYYNKKVYVYVATPNGQLQLCISELPHDTNSDGATQDWEVD